MAIETEVRYLLFTAPSLAGVTPDPIVQGYLSTDKDRTIRIRQIGGGGGRGVNH